MSTQFEEKTKTICFDLVGRIQELDKAAHGMGKIALFEPGSINNHVEAIIAAARDEQVERVQKDLVFLREIEGHLTGNFGDRIGQEYALQMVQDWIAELARLKGESK